MTEKMPDGTKMEEHSRAEYYEEDVIDLGKYFSILRHHWWKIAGLSLAVGVVTLLLMFLKPNMYRSSATISPVEEDTRRSPNLGALVSLGLPVGETANVLELEALFRSDDLKVRVFRNHDFWPVLFPDRYDKTTGKLTAGKGLLSGLLGSDKEPKAPGEWTAIRVAQAGLTVSLNRKVRTLDISFESRSPEGSAEIVRAFLEEAKNRLQEEALERATKNKKFIEGQIGKTVDALTRERLYSLYGYETEREMMARNREQFGFRVIDSPRVPDRKSRPARAKGAITATVVSFFLWCGIFIARGKSGLKGSISESHHPQGK